MTVATHLAKSAAESAPTTAVDADADAEADADADAEADAEAAVAVDAEAAVEAQVPVRVEARVEAGAQAEVRTGSRLTPDPATETGSTTLLQVRGLRVSYRSRSGLAARTRVLDDVGFEVSAGEIVGVVGETGSGKTTLARAVLGLVEPEAGEVRLDGRETSGLRGRARRQFRRTGSVGVVFQDPLRALDPDLTIGASVGEGLRITGASRRERIELVAEALRRVGLDPALADRVPAGISGGQRQRVSIARAVVGRPRLLLCDEPVSALDASNRNHILRLLDDLRRELAVGVVVISHDLSSLAGIADRVVVLYRGRVVEDGPIAEVFTRPRHPYTALLIASAPSVRPETGVSAAALRPGPERRWPHAGAGECVFAHRCRFATEACTSTPPTEPVPARAVGTAAAWSVACHHAATWRSALLAPPAPPTHAGSTPVARAHEAESRRES